MATILVVDDEYLILESLEMFLSEKGHSVLTADTGADGLRQYFRCHPHVVLLDIRLPDRNGLEILKAILAAPNPPKVIMMTAFQDMETTIEAMKSGAYDYLSKPLDIDEVERALERAIRLALAERNGQKPSVDILTTSRDVMIGKSPAIREIFKTIGMLCRNQATVLIQGETGTGKELIARIIHQNSPFSEQPMITLDCSAIVESLLENELFGHSKGAFTGAVENRPGKIELAGKGTLFLDEVTEMPLSVQGKFLGVLERREFMRVGGANIHKSLCRIISATNRNIEGCVRQGKFREDLYYRLKVVTIHVPPLRERRRDIPELAEYFLKKAAATIGVEAGQFEAGVMERLCAHPWSGNVRELKHVIMAAALRSRGSIVLLEDIERELASAICQSGNDSSDFSLDSVERDQIRNALSHTGWNRSKAARLLGISLPTLRAKIARYGLVPESVSARHLR